MCRFERPILRPAAVCLEMDAVTGCVRPESVLDLPVASRGAIDPWAATEGPELELMRRLKRRFDPAGVCNPGIFVGRI